MPYSKICDTFRPRRGEISTRRTDLGTQSFGNDFARCSRRNRLILKHRAQHGPAGVGHRFCHVRPLEPGRADISDNDPVMGLHQVGGDLVQEILSLVCDLCCEGARTDLLATALVEREAVFGTPVERRHFDLIAVGQGGERLQPQVNADLGTDGARLRRLRLDLDVGIPSATGVSGKAPRLESASFWDGAGKPEVIVPLQERELVPGQLRGAAEVGERHPVQIAFEGPEARRIRECRLPSIRELLANRVNRIGMNPEFLGDTTAEISQVEGRRALDIAPGLPLRCGLPIDLAAVVPNVIDRSRLRSKRSACRTRSIPDAVSVGQNHDANIGERNFLRHLKEAVSMPIFL